MQPLLLLLALILLPGAKAGKIIGGQEARPHSHPYMAYLQVGSPEDLTSCGGFLVREDFVMTAAHCWGSVINVTLGAHNIRRLERTQQRISVLRAIPHPGYDQQTFLNDIMLLQLRNRIRRNRVVRPVALPNAGEKLRPGALCTVAGWGRVSLDRRTDRLQEAQLRVQSDRKCSRRFSTYSSQTEICVGDPRQRKVAFKHLEEWEEDLHTAYTYAASSWRRGILVAPWCVTIKLKALSPMETAKELLRKSSPGS
ncbi:cathepsin G isoform X1 [Heterocephalus glaber]|uniref:Cathepsin G isoform X1 n=1 Tax=Heterocephalus glaber TaxID=10181 RepID=A0AAX6Q378_HETGA|nr:cathepsin G isoform X1 [Heterocephalus glaber]